MRLDADVRQLAETMQQRRREAKKRVGTQEIIGMRFMPESDVLAAAERNWGRLVDATASGSLTDLADAGNYALELIRRAGD